MAPITLPKIPGFNDLPDTVLAAGEYAIGRHAAAIKGNADFGMVYPEFFQTVQVHDDVVPLPVSAVDGYKYSRSELVYVWSVQTSASQKSGWESGPGSLWFAQWFVQPWNDTPGSDNSGAGKVTCEEYYRTSGHDNGKSNDGVLMVTTVAIRRRAALTMAAVPAFADMSDSLFATDQPYAETRLKNLNHDAKFAIVNSEVIYMGQYGNGDVVLPPVSPVDGYAYSYAEVEQFVYSWVWTTPRSGFATPTRSNGKPQNQLGRLEANVDATGNVSTSVIYYDDGEIPTNDGLLAVVAFCRRKFCECGPAVYGDGSDGSVTFDGSTSVAGASLSGGIYSVSRDTNYVDATVNPGIEVRWCNYKFRGTGKLTIGLGAKCHNNGQDAFPAGCPGTIPAAANSTNPDHAGSLLLSAPGRAANGNCQGANVIPQGGPGGPGTAGGMPAWGIGANGGRARKCDGTLDDSTWVTPAAENGSGGASGNHCSIFGVNGGGGQGGNAGGNACRGYVAFHDIENNGSLECHGGDASPGGAGNGAVNGDCAGSGGGGALGGAGADLDIYCVNYSGTGTFNVSGGAPSAGGPAGVSDDSSRNGEAGGDCVGVAPMGTVTFHPCCDDGTETPPTDGTSYAWFDDLLLSKCLPARADLLLQILKNAREASLRPEFFDSGVFTNGDTVPLPTGADGYSYARDECCYIPMLADTGAETSGSIRVCTFSASVDAATGNVTTERFALLDGGTTVRSVHTLTVRVLTVAIRSAQAPTPETPPAGGIGPPGGGGDSGGGGTTFITGSQTIANEWTAVNDAGTYSYSQQTAFSGNGSDQGISVNTGSGNSAGIRGKRIACSPGDVFSLMFRAAASVSITSGFSYGIYLWNADLTASARIDLAAGALGAEEQIQVALKVPASSDTALWTDVGSISISAAGFTPAFVALEFDIDNPSATTTVTVGDATLRKIDNARTLQREGYVYAVDTGAANAYAIAQTPAPTLVAGSEAVFIATHTNTGASTLAVNGGAAIAIKKISSGSLVDLAAGDISANQLVTVKYDGTVWQMPSSGSSLPLTTLGDTLYEDATPAPARLPGNTTAIKKFYTQTGTGAVSAAPAWDTIAASDCPPGVAVRRVSFGGSVSATGVIGLAAQIDFAGTIIGWSCFVDAGTISIDVCKHSGSAPPSAPSVPNTTTDKISASAPIEVSSGTSASGAATAVSTWATTVSQWDSILLNVSAISGVAKVQGEILIQQT